MEDSENRCVNSLVFNKVTMEMVIFHTNMTSSDQSEISRAINFSLRTFCPHKESSCLVPRVLVVEMQGTMKTYCELGVIKYILFVFNLIFAISGIGLIIAGSLVLADVGEFGHFLEGKILAPPVVLIVAGCIVFLVASLGCYGAMRESYYMLIAFALCLLIIFIVEFAVGIAAATYKSQFQTVLKDAMTDSLNKYETSKSDKIAWDNIQKKLSCCGVDGPNDWTKRPSSCCHPTREDAPDPSAEHCRNAKPGDDFLYNYGCFDELQMKAESSAKVLIGVGIGIAFVQIIGIILACWMASAVKNKE